MLWSGNSGNPEKAKTHYEGSTRAACCANMWVEDTADIPWRIRSFMYHCDNMRIFGCDGIVAIRREWRMQTECPVP